MVVTNGSKSEGLAGYVSWLSVLGLAPAFFLMARLFVDGSVRCFLCWASYLPLVGLFLVAPADRQPLLSLPRRLTADLRDLVASPPGLLITGLLSGIAAIGFVLFGSASRSGIAAAADASLPAAGLSPAAFRDWWLRQPRRQVAEPEAANQVVVLKFHDYQCPACGEAFRSYRPVLERYARERPGAVRVVSKDFPLEPECNVAVTVPLHPLACETAAAVRLADKNGNREVVEARFFAAGGSLTAEGVWQVLRELGLKGPDDPGYQDLLNQIREDTRLGRDLGVTVTPTFLLAGVKLRGALSAVHFQAALDLELARQAGVDR
jgi:protein-disulfide isomerase